MMRRGRPFGHKAKFEMADDPVDNLWIFNERDDPHPAATGRTDQGIHLVAFSYHLGPAFGRDRRQVIFDDGRIRRLVPGFAHLAPVRV